MSSNIVVKNEILRLVVKSEENNIVVKNADGKDGKSAFQQAVEGGYTGTEQEFNCSLSLLSDVADGKKRIAEAINTKGGNSAPDESFQQLAEDIDSLPIDGNLTYGIKFVDDNNILENLSSGISFDNQIEEINDTKGVITIFRGVVYAKTAIRLDHISISQGIYNAPIISLAMCRDVGAAYFTRVQVYELTLGKLKTWSANFSDNQYFLRNVIIGEGSDANITVLYRWLATNVIAEGQSGIDELNENLYNNLLTKLYDHSQDGQTRTLRLGWLAYVKQENIDYANSKGWTLTT